MGDLEKPSEVVHVDSWIKRKRHELFKVMGNQCCKCGFRDRRALQIDHVLGDGRYERGIPPGQYYAMVKESFEANENRYQLLCANCNWIKKVVNLENKRPRVNEIRVCSSGEKWLRDNRRDIQREHWN